MQRTETGVRQKRLHQSRQPRVECGGLHNINERVNQLVEELGIERNRLLHNHPQVKAKLIDTVAKFEEVFTTNEKKVGKTDKLSSKITLSLLEPTFAGSSRSFRSL